MPKKQNPRREVLVRMKRENPRLRQLVLTQVDRLGSYGFHAQTIADICGIGKSQVYQITRMLGFRLRDYRDGKTESAKIIISVTPRVKMRTLRKKPRAWMFRTSVAICEGR